jgi:murein L,D-transpeptidase YcbB/YkuD
MRHGASLVSNTNRFFYSCFAGVLFVILSLLSCDDISQPAGKQIVNIPQQMDAKVKELIAASLDYASSKEGKVDDSILLKNFSLLSLIYRENSHSPLWCSSQKWLVQGDSLLDFIEQSKLFGLFPSDYHFDRLHDIQNLLLADSLMQKERKDAALWARADLMLSDALISVIKDIKLGRLPADSITLRKDSVLKDGFVKEKFKSIVKGNSLHAVIASLEPGHAGYHQLKAGIKDFLRAADFKNISIIDYPAKNSTELMAAIIKRLFESGYIDSATAKPGSVQLATVLKKYQTDNKLTADGKIGAQTIRQLNLSDREKFYRIAITLDRYKMLPEQMPEIFIWINIPSFTLKLISNDAVIVSSRIVVGKQKTRTPVLNSAISEMITYPQWNIPQSIIVKEILPALKKNPGYLARKGYGLFDQMGEEIDPFSVDWSKYKKGIPYRIIQGSGDDNALGILKFNFVNKYAVYLHDTNQRYYFGLDSRALSHGCIRVQEWEKIAYFILNLENEFAKVQNRNFVPADSLRHWLASKEKHTIPISIKVPVYIRYFTCENINGKVVFFEDIYDEDRDLADKIFSGKKAGL